MFTKFEPFIALRYLKSRRKEVFISIITVISVMGVAISVMVLDMVLAIMTGFTEELQSKLINANAHIVVRRYGGPIENWENLSTELETHEEVVSATPFSYSQAMVMTQAGARGLLIRGVADKEIPRKKLLENLPDEEILDKLFQRQPVKVYRPDGTDDSVKLPSLLVGRSLQKKLGLPVGEPVTLLAPQMNASPRGLIPKSKRFTIIGSYKSGLVEYEDGLAYVDLREAQKFFKMGDAVTGIELEIKDLWQAQELAAELSETVNASLGGYYFTDWSEPNKPLWEALKLEKKVYFIVLLLLILVASFSIVSTLVMVVMEKRKDIAIMKAMGAANRQVTKIFLLQGVIIGVLGTIIGTILGYAGCVALRSYGFEIQETVFSLSTVPVRMEPVNFATVAVAAFLITALAGVYPAIKAGRTKPAEILRFD